MKFSFITAGVIVAMASTLPPVQAGSVTDAAAKAEALADEGKSRDAIFALDLAVDNLWKKVGLNVLVAKFVSDRPKGYGAYDPRPNSTFKPGEDMVVYAELAGYGFGRDGDHFTISLKADVEVKTKEGKFIGEQKDFLQLGHKSRVPAREFFAVLTYSFSGLTPGEYVVTTRFNDQNVGQWAETSSPFTIE